MLKKTFMAIGLGILSSGIVFNAHAAAFMYCINPDDFFDSMRTPPWARGADKSWLEKDGTGWETIGRVMLNGEFDHSGDPNSFTFVLKDSARADFVPRVSPKEYCEQLVNICTSLWPERRFIGAMDQNARPEPESLFDNRNLNGIALRKGKEIYQCPNWRVYKSEYKKEGFRESAKYFYDVACTGNTEPQRFTLGSQNGNLAWTNGKKTYVLPMSADSREVYTMDLTTAVVDAEVGRRFCSGQQRPVERD